MAQFQICLQLCEGRGLSGFKSKAMDCQLEFLRRILDMLAASPNRYLEIPMDNVALQAVTYKSLAGVDTDPFQESGNL